MTQRPTPSPTRRAGRRAGPEPPPSYGALGGAGGAGGLAAQERQLGGAGTVLGGELIGLHGDAGAVELVELGLDLGRRGLGFGREQRAQRASMAASTRSVLARMPVASAKRRARVGWRRAKGRPARCTARSSGRW